jgi:hypothetical protein
MGLSYGSLVSISLLMKGTTMLPSMAPIIVEKLDGKSSDWIGKVSDKEYLC